MSETGFKWISLEPFVHGVVRNNEVLLYNTVNKKYLIFRHIPEITAITEKLLDPENSYVHQITDNQLQSPVIRKFIEQLRKKFMGDLLDPGWSISKPFNIAPQPMVKKGSRKLEHQLHEITFHLNTGSDKNLVLFKNASKQFIFPIYADGPVIERSADILHTVFSQITSLPLATLNFTGSGIFNSPTLNKVNDIFARTAFRRNYHIPLFHIKPDPDLVLRKMDWLSLYINFPLDLLQFDYLSELIQQHEKSQRLECYFIVQDSEEVEKAMAIINQLSIRRVFFKPYFNGDNLQFFKDNVFITEEDLKSSQPSQKQIFSRISMNENDFGKLIILPDGSVKANMNDDPIGNIKTSTLEDLIQSELNTGKSWKRMRTTVTPCNDCIFQFLCPPISNYEIFLRRFNFCHIHP